MKYCVLFKTHKWNNEINENFNKLKKILNYFNNLDLFIAYDDTNQKCLIEYENIHVFNENLPKKRSFINFKTDVKYNTTESYFDKSPNWFNTEYVLIDFFIDNHNYDLYWMIENDVDYENWVDFFNICNNFIEDNNIDFASTHIKSNIFINNQISLDENWGWWKSHNTDLKTLLGCFFPISCFSNQSLSTLNKNYLLKKHGFGEIIVPTILFNNNLNIIDLKYVYQDLSLIKHNNCYELI